MIKKLIILVRIASYASWKCENEGIPLHKDIRVDEELDNKSKIPDDNAEQYVDNLLKSLDVFVWDDENNERCNING